MGLQSALFTSLTGLTAAETSIDVAGNNVANANTVGFKESDVSFATQLLQTQSIGSGPADNRGGTNPRQIGLGVKVAEISPDFTQGTVQISSNPLDLAIQGDGFFIVQGPRGNDDKLYTRNGQFKTNGSNEIVTTTGQRMLGYGVNENYEIDTSQLTSITIPLGAAQVAQATENVFMSGPLDATAPIPKTPEIIESVVFSDGTYDVPTDTLAPEALARPNDPSTITVNTSGGSVLVNDGTYNYRVTLVHANGQEGPPSEVFFINKNSGNSIDIGGFAALPSSDWVGYNIYRNNPATDSTFRRVNSSPHTTGTFNDVSQDLAIASNPTLNDTELETDNYQYYVTFYNGIVESQPTALSDSVTLNNGTSPWAYLSNIPQPPSGGDFNQVRIYRNSEQNSTVYRLMDTIPAGQTEYIDNNTDASFSSQPVVNLDGPPISSSVRVVDLKTRTGTSYVNPFVAGTLEFTPEKGGRALGTSTFEITNSTTVAQLVRFMEQSMGIVTDPIQGATEDSFDLDPISIDGESYTLGGQVKDSKIVFRSNYGKANAVDIDLSAMQLTPTGSTTSSAVSVAFGSVHESTNVVDGEGSSSDFVVYDSLGSPLTVRFTTVLEETTDFEARFRWIATSVDNQPLNGSDTVVGTGLIITDHDGKFVSSTNDEVNIQRTVSPASSPLQFTLDFSQVSGLDTGDNDVQASRQDGFPAGSLASFFITESGEIQGVFSNGSTRPLGQLLMARFANNAGLEQKGENLYAAGVNSGLPVEGIPGTKGLGSILAGSVELSNTDIGQNLIELITASTQYRGGARVITSVQELLDELLALRR